MLDGLNLLYPAYPLFCQIMDGKIARFNHTPRPHPNPEPYGVPWVVFGHTIIEARLQPGPEFHGTFWVVMWPHQPSNQIAPRPRALWSSMRFHLVTQNIRLDHIQTPSLMEPHGVCVVLQNLHLDPKPDGALLGTVNMLFRALWSSIET